MPNQNVAELVQLHQNPFEQGRPTTQPRSPIVNRRRARLGLSLLGSPLGLGRGVSRGVQAERLAERITRQGHPSYEEIQRIRSVFIFREASKVSEFLNENLFLINLLLEASRKIQEQFGTDTRMALKVIRDSDVDGDREVFLIIQTSLSVQEALNKLDQLDQQWWLEALPRARGQMNIVLEYI